LALVTGEDHGFVTEILIGSATSSSFELDLQRMFSDMDFVVIVQNGTAIMLDYFGMLLGHPQIVDRNIVTGVSADGNFSLIGFDGFDFRIFEFQQNRKHYAPS
jgi:hypothetical protein